MVGGDADVSAGAQPTRGGVFSISVLKLWSFEDPAGGEGRYLECLPWVGVAVSSFFGEVLFLPVVHG